MASSETAHGTIIIIIMFSSAPTRVKTRTEERNDGASTELK